MDAIVLASIVGALLGLHAWAWLHFAPRAPIGDECDYLARSQWPDPHRPTMFLRVPLMPAMARMAGRISAAPESAMRAGVAAMGALAAIATVLAAYRLDGLAAAAIAATAMSLVVERVLLASHLWPDTPLCALHAFALLALTYAPSPALMLALGAIVALATMIRIEQIALGLGIVGVLLWRDPAQFLWIGLIVLGPTFVALALWTIVAWTRYRIPMPDTTWWFNLRLLNHQLSERRAGPVVVHASISGMMSDDASSHANGVSIARYFDRPIALLVSVIRRLVACFGPDTFVSGRLLPPMGLAYPAMSASTSARLAPWLRWSFPLAGAISAWALFANHVASELLIATIPVLGALVVVHFRTRYRLLLMPWLFGIGAASLSGLDPGALGLGHAAIGAALLLVTWLNVRHPAIVEHEAQRSGSGQVD